MKSSALILNFVPKRWLRWPGCSHPDAAKSSTCATTTGAALFEDRSVTATRIFRRCSDESDREDTRTLSQDTQTYEEERTMTRFVDPTIISSGGRLTAEVASKPKRGLPRWLRQRIRRKYPNVSPGTESSVILGLWLDHYGVVGQDGQEYFIAEPYDLEARTIENLQEFCREFDLDFHISATSYHFPTQTLRITVWPKGER